MNVTEHTGGSGGIQCLVGSAELAHTKLGMSAMILSKS
jgi:hypothetical protein